jgi:hypothetical protein
MACTIGSPSPDPSAFVVKNGSKMRSRISGGTPRPLSSTRISTWSGSSPTRHENRTQPPAGTASMAFSPRFITTCCRRSSSPATGGTASKSRRTRTPRFSAGPPSSVSTRSSTGATSTGFG